MHSFALELTCRGTSLLQAFHMRRSHVPGSKKANPFLSWPFPGRKRRDTKSGNLQSKHFRLQKVDLCGAQGKRFSIYNLQSAFFNVFNLPFNLQSSICILQCFHSPLQSTIFNLQSTMFGAPSEIRTRVPSLKSS